MYFQKTLSSPINPCGSLNSKHLCYNSKYKNWTCLIIEPIYTGFFLFDYVKSNFGQKLDMSGCLKVFNFVCSRLCNNMQYIFYLLFSFFYDI